MPNAPESYVDQQRPSLVDAIRAEGVVTIGAAFPSLERKGYFTARPRPWKLGFHNRGLGHRDFTVLDRFGDLVTETPQRADAELIIAAVNAYKS